MNERRRHSIAPTTRAEYTCIAKKRYDSERQACIHGQQRSDVINAPLYVYRCRECRGWHLTKKFHHLGKPMKRAKTTSKP